MSMSMAGCRSTRCICTSLFIWTLTCLAMSWKSVEAATLSPRSINVSQGDSEIVIKCTETETDERYLRWTIMFDVRVQPVELTLNRQFNERDILVPEVDLFFYSNWTSFDPLCSTLTINTASVSLNGATVVCATRSTVQPMDTLSITVRGNEPNILWLEITSYGDLEAASDTDVLSNVTVIVEWESDGVGPVDYYVTVTPLDGNGSVPSTITTNKTSYLLTVPYNSTYNISVVGSNCAGNSSELVKTFTFTTPRARCTSLHENLPEGVTLVDEDVLEDNFVNDSQFNLTCTSEDRILNRSNTVITCTCTSGGNCGWFPEISKIQCMSVSPKEKGLGLGDVYVIILSAVIPPLGAFIILGTVIAISIAVRRKQGNRRSQQVLDEILREESYARLHAVNPSVNPKGIRLEPPGNYSLLSPDRNIYDAVYDILEQPKAVDNSDKIPLSDNVSYSGTVDDEDQETQQNSLLVNLDSLLSKLQSVQKTSKWQQLAAATEMPREIVDELTGCSDEESRIKIVENWLRTQEKDLNWKEVAKEMRDVGLELLAEEIETWTTDHQSCDLTTQLDTREKDGTDNEVTARAPTPASVLQD